jgi:predicted tellurium resistance membrane protein TerC
MLLVFGLLVSIPLVVVGSKLVLSALDRFPAIIVLGGALLGWIAGELIATDPLTAPHLAGLPSWTHYAFSATGAILVVAVAKWLLHRHAAARNSRETA